MTQKKAVILANELATTALQEGAAAVVVGVTMPDGTYFVAHSAPASKKPWALDCIVNAAVQEMAEGWPGATIKKPTQGPTHDG